MFYPPPGFGPMNPYAMGFPPQGMPPYGGPGYPRPLAAEVHNGGRGPRPFQNRKWVNPNVAKAEEARGTKTRQQRIQADLKQVVCLKTLVRPLLRHAIHTTHRRCVRDSKTRRGCDRTLRRTRS